MDIGEELGFARELAELGARLAFGHFRHDVQRTRKADGTWVTEVDWAVEAQIRLRIARSRPEHNILGEEEGLTAAGGGPARDGAPTWVVDPIDGTNNFIAGIPIWATLVALRVDDRNVAGVCHAPALGETYHAMLGGGAYFNDEPIFADDGTALSEATMLTAGATKAAYGDYGDAVEALAQRCVRTRGLGDFWGHMLVARGAAHIMFEAELSLWDVAALEPIVAEAGARLTHADGTPWTQRGTCLTTTRSLHDEVVEMLSER